MHFYCIYCTDNTNECYICRIPIIRLPNVPATREKVILIDELPEIEVYFPEEFKTPEPTIEPVLKLSPVPELLPIHFQIQTIHLKTGNKINEWRIKLDVEDS